MHKTIYIDIDEEIIGIIHKIKYAEANEIFLVIPKNSLLTQGLVNLKILKKEVAKMGKEIILVTSDAHSKKIIELVGLKTKIKSVQDFVKEDSNQSNESGLDSNLNHSMKEVDFDENRIKLEPKKREIGTASFYEQEPRHINQEPEINLKNEDDSLVAPQKQSENFKLRVSRENTFGKEYVDYYNSKEIEKERTEIPEGQQVEKAKLINKNIQFNPFQGVINKESSRSIDDFYSDKNDNIEKEIKKDQHLKKPTSNSRKIIFWLAGFLTILIIISIGGWLAFDKWPRMKLDLYLKEKLLEKTVSLEVCENKESGDNCIKGDYQEIIVELTEKYSATGEKFSNDKGMARGIVKIYNNYSNQPQPLIATTRILSKEGKLFRLVKNITVPGMTSEAPGVIEAQVIADKIGTDYNIGASEFTVEGFKGGEKYDKFKIISESAMIGGANDTENKKVKVVQKNDIDNAREKTLEKFNKELEKNLRDKLNPNETFVLSSIEKNIINSDSSYAPDDIIDEFNYTVRQKIKVITFSEIDFEKRILQAFDGSDEIKNLEFNKISEINYQKDIANYDKKELDLVVQAKILYWPIINKNEILDELIQSDSSQIKNYLSNLEQINKAIISYSPSWLSNFPIKSKNIKIVEIK